MEDSIHIEFLEDVDKFTNEEIRPYTTKFEEEQKIPRSLIEKLAERGYLAASFPKEYGGLGLNPVQYGLFTEVIGKACASTRAILTVHTSLVGETILRCGTDHQKKELLPKMAKGEILTAFALSEPNIGTDAKGVETVYTTNGESYIINGKKKWITLSGIADLFLVIANGEPGISAIFVDSKSKGVKVTPIRGLLAGRSAYISEIEFNNVIVPKENLLGKEGQGFTYIVNTALDFGRYSIAWGGLGIAQEAMEQMVNYSRNRKQFGRSLYSNQLIQGMLGDSVTKIHAGRALCLRAGEYRIKNNQDAIVETTIAKYYTSKIAMEIAIDAVQIHGGNGCCNQYPVERLFREAKILEIIEGTSQVQQEIISRFGLRRYYNV